MTIHLQGPRRLVLALTLIAMLAALLYPAWSIESTPTLEARQAGEVRRIIPGNERQFLFNPPQVGYDPILHSIGRIHRPILNKTRLLLDWGVVLAFGTILFWGVNGKRRHV